MGAGDGKSRKGGGEGEREGGRKEKGGKGKGEQVGRGRGAKAGERRRGGRRRESQRVRQARQEKRRFRVQTEPSRLAASLLTIQCTQRNHGLPGSPAAERKVLGTARG